VTDREPHPVELVNYFFPEQTVRANPQHDPDAEISMSSQMEINFTHLPDTQARLYACELSIELNEDESNNPTYFYRVVAYGIFSVGDELEEEKVETFARTTAAQILIDVARERIAEITSRGPWDRVLITIASLSPGMLQE